MIYVNKHAYESWAIGWAQEVAYELGHQCARATPSGLLAVTQSLEELNARWFVAAIDAQRVEGRAPGVMSWKFEQLVEGRLSGDDVPFQRLSWKTRSGELVVHVDQFPVGHDRLDLHFWVPEERCPNEGCFSGLYRNECEICAGTGILSPAVQVAVVRLLANEQRVSLRTEGVRWDQLSGTAMRLLGRLMHVLDMDEAESDKESQRLLSLADMAFMR